MSRLLGPRSRSLTSSSRQTIFSLGVMPEPGSNPSHSPPTECPPFASLKRGPDTRFFLPFEALRWTECLAKRQNDSRVDVVAIGDRVRVRLPVSARRYDRGDF